MLLSFAGEPLGSLLALLWERRLCFGYWEGPLGSVWLLPLASEILSDVLGNSPGLTGEPFSGTDWSPRNSKGDVQKCYKRILVAAFPCSGLFWL